MVIKIEENNSIQRTFVAIKPDGVARSLIGKIITRFEDVGLKIVGMKLMQANPELIKQHYIEHAEKHFFSTFEAYFSEGPIVAMVIEGVGAIKLVRKIVGSTEPHSAALGTIRGDYCHTSLSYANVKGIPGRNLIHASANLNDAQREISLWFSDEEILNHKLAHDHITL